MTDNTQGGRIILQQMGGSHKIAAMPGASRFLTYPSTRDSEHGAGEGALSFRFPRPGKGKPNYIKVVLEADDTYTVLFKSLHNRRCRTTKSYNGVYAENLKSLFESETGLYLTF